MLRAHRQAWCWQDEWYGLKLSDIRRLELETQRALAEKMAAANGETDSENNARSENGEQSADRSISGQPPSSFSVLDSTAPNSVATATVSGECRNRPYVKASPSRDKMTVPESFSSGHISAKRRESWGSKHSLNGESESLCLLCEWLD